jgi:hypothetical protein
MNLEKGIQVTIYLIKAWDDNIFMVYTSPPDPLSSKERGKRGRGASALQGELQDEPLLDAPFKYSKSRQYCIITGQQPVY